MHRRQGFDASSLRIVQNFFVMMTSMFCMNGAPKVSIKILDKELECFEHAAG